MEERNKGRFIRGNPGGPGRPKKKSRDPQALDLLRELSPQAVIYLAELLHSADEDIVLRTSIAILEMYLKYEQDGFIMDEAHREYFKHLYEEVERQNRF